MLQGIIDHGIEAYQGIVRPLYEVSVAHCRRAVAACRFLCWLGGLLPALVLLFPADVAASAREDLQRLLQDYRRRLERLAWQAHQAGHTQLARQAAGWLPQLPERLTVVYLLEEESVEASVSASSGDRREKKDSHQHPALREQFDQLRKQQAEAFFQLARQAAREGQVALALECLNHAARDDPDHPHLRRFWGFRRFQDRWVRSLAAGRLRRGWVDHPRWGWLPKGHVERYERGQRRVRSRWVSRTEAQRYHSNPRTPWRVETQHFVVETTTSLEQGVAVARRLEKLFHVWRVLFAAYAYQPSQVRKALDSPRGLPAPRTKFRVTYFATEQQYRQALQQHLPPQVRTFGLYLAPLRRSFFFVPEEPDDPTLFHELTHQFCNETRSVAGQVGRKANFWIVEGVACYMESLQLDGNRAVLGGVDADRLQDARYYLYHDRFYLPLERLCALGMQPLQQHAEITKLYAQAAAWTHLLMHAERGRYRAVLMQYLDQVFRGRDDPGTLRRLLSRSWQELDAQYRQFMQLEDADLAALAKPNRVEYLVLCGTRVTDAGLARLPRLPRLSWLDLAGTAVTDRGLEHLLRLSALRRLDLSHTAVTGEGLAVLERLPKLERLFLRGTQVAPAAVERLRKRRPGLKVVGIGRKP